MLVQCTCSFSIINFVWTGLPSTPARCWVTRCREEEREQSCWAPLNSWKLTWAWPENVRLSSSAKGNDQKILGWAQLPVFWLMAFDKRIWIDRMRIGMNGRGGIYWIAVLKNSTQSHIFIRESPMQVCSKI